MLKITLVKSVIGSTPTNRRTVQALGLRKIGKFVFKQDIPSIRGMLRNIDHLIEMVEVDDEPKKAAKQTAVATEAVSKATAVKEPPKKKPAAKKTATKKPAAKKPAAKKAPTKRKSFAEIGDKSKSEKKSTAKKKDQ